MNKITIHIALYPTPFEKDVKVVEVPYWTEKEIIKYLRDNFIDSYINTDTEWSQPRNEDGSPVDDKYYKVHRCHKRPYDADWDIKSIKIAEFLGLTDN